MGQLTCSTRPVPGVHVRVPREAERARVSTILEVSRKLPRKPEQNRVINCDVFTSFPSITGISRTSSGSEPGRTCPPVTVHAHRHQSGCLILNASRSADVIDVCNPNDQNHRRFRFCFFQAG